MKVLFQNRKTALTNWGGDTTQMVRTKDELEKLGVQVDMSMDARPDLAGYDIVHVFNIQTADYSVEQVRNAREHGVPVALSTIFWDMRHMPLCRDYLTYHSSSAVRLLARIDARLAALAIKARRTKQYRLMREMLDGADILLPNSAAECEIIADVFYMPMARDKSVIVPNGVDVNLRPVQSESTHGTLAALPDEYLLQVANFDPGKCQLRLIKALMDFPAIPIVFIGRPSSIPYFNACRALADKRGNTYFVDQVPHDQIDFFFRRARVHALPSLRESPGLSTLEASLNGSNCVVSIYGPIEEYFGDDVWVCDPFKLQTISKAVTEAWSAPRNTRLKDRILNEFTWRKAAEATLAGYKRILPDAR